MADRKNIESSKVEGLIPRQLVEDSSALVEFLKEYYRFLNEEGGPSYALNNLLNNRDIDLAIDDFLTLVHNEIGTGFAKEIRYLQADKNNLYKHIKEFYSCKGSLDSFQTLFKLLFNVNVEIILPKEKILVASDGNWSQQESFFIETTSGDPLELVGKIITITSLNNYIDVEVERIRKVYPAQDFYEIFITRNRDTNRIVVGATLDAYGVAGTVIKSLGNIEIIYAGQNFDPPQFVEIDYQSTGTLIRISEVDLNGAITKFKVLSFGIGYANDFYARIVPKDEIVTDDLIVINEVDIDTEIENNPTHAILKFTNGAIAKYPGEYTTNKGFLSDDIYLQDNYYYQQFSYVIKSGIQIENYSDVVKKTVHPAGMIFFGQFEITNILNLAQNIQSLARYLRARLSSPPVDAEDLLSVYFEKILPGDTVDVENNDFQYTDFYKSLSTSTDPATDFQYTDFYKNLSTSQSISDSNYTDFSKLLETSTNPLDDQLSVFVDKSLAHSVNVENQDLLSVSFSKSLSTTTDAVTDFQSLEFFKVLSSSASTSDSNDILFYKVLESETTPTDSSSTSFKKELTGDSITLNDTTTLIFDKSLSSSASTSDDISFEMIYNLTLSSSATAVSSFSIEVVEIPFDDGISSSDSINDIIVEKIITESINITEVGRADLNPYVLDQVYFFESQDYIEGIYTIT